MAKNISRRKVFIVKYHYEGYGKGHPGWNANIQILTLDGEEIGYMSYPMVNNEIRRGILRGVSSSIDKMFGSNSSRKISRQDLDEILSHYAQACIHPFSEDESKAFPLLSKAVTDKIFIIDKKREAQKIARDEAAKLVSQSHKLWNDPSKEMTWFISSSGYYKPSVGNGPENRERVNDGKLKIRALNLKPGDYVQFVYKGLRLSLSVREETQEADLEILATSHWANSQNWWYDEINPNNAPSEGTLFVNGVDVFDMTQEALKEQKAKEAEAKKERREYFQKILAEAEKAGIKKDIACRIVRKNNVSVLKTVAELIIKKVAKEAALRVARKAYAWQYAYDCLGGDIEFPRHLDNLKAACLVYNKLPA